MQWKSGVLLDASSWPAAVWCADAVTWHVDFKTAFFGRVFYFVALSPSAGAMDSANRPNRTR